MKKSSFYCDLCKKEIEYEYDLWWLSADSHKQEHNFSVDHMCEPCALEIFAVVQRLKGATLTHPLLMKKNQESE